MTLVELLKDFGIEEERAERVSSNWPEKKFDDTFIELESLACGNFDIASNIVVEGELLDYHNSQIDDYMRLARVASKRIIEGQRDHQVHRVHASIFYSLDSLKGYIDGPESDRKEVDVSGLNVRLYRILHADHPQSVIYLNELIEDRGITFGDHEHWSKSGDGKNGPRGSNIAIKIQIQLKSIFNELVLEEPGVKVNFGQRIINVDEYTSGMLKEIRAKVYSDK